MSAAFMTRFFALTGEVHDVACHRWLSVTEAEAQVTIWLALSQVALAGARPRLANVFIRDATDLSEAVAIAKDWVRAA